MHAQGVQEKGVQAWRGRQDASRPTPTRTCGARSDHRKRGVRDPRRLTAGEARGATTHLAQKDPAVKPPSRCLGWPARNGRGWKARADRSAACFGAPGCTITTGTALREAAGGTIPTPPDTEDPTPGLISAQPDISPTPCAAEPGLTRPARPADARFSAARRAEQRPGQAAARWGLQRDSPLPPPPRGQQSLRGAVLKGSGLSLRLLPPRPPSSPRLGREDGLDRLSPAPPPPRSPLQPKSGRQRLPRSLPPPDWRINWSGGGANGRVRPGRAQRRVRRGAARRRARQERRPRAPADRHARTPQAQRPPLRLPHPHGGALAPPRRRARLWRFAPPPGFRGPATTTSGKRLPLRYAYVYLGPEMRSKRARSVAAQTRAETKRAPAVVARLCPASPAAMWGTSSQATAFHGSSCLLPGRTCQLYPSTAGYGQHAAG